MMMRGDLGEALGSMTPVLQPRRVGRLPGRSASACSTSWPASASPTRSCSPVTSTRPGSPTSSRTSSSRASPTVAAEFVCTSITSDFPAAFVRAGRGQPWAHEPQPPHPLLRGSAPRLHAVRGHPRALARGLSHRRRVERPRFDGPDGGGMGGRRRDTRRAPAVSAAPSGHAQVSMQNERSNRSKKLPPPPSSLSLDQPDTESS